MAGPLVKSRIAYSVFAMSASGCNRSVYIGGGAVFCLRASCALRYGRESCDRELARLPDCEAGPREDLPLRVAVGPGLLTRDDDPMGEG